MTDPVFLVDVLPAGDTAVLDGAEGRHAATVRRITTGERVVLSDGAGGTAQCLVIEVQRDSLRLAVESVEQLSAPEPRLVVVQALPKGDRGELAVEMMTEAGVDEIIPWRAQHCITQWRGERGDKALAKWRSTAREAAKQARRAWLPVVSPAASTAEVAARLASAPLALVLHEAASDRLSQVTLPDHPAEIVLVVGPEGGVAPAEISAFSDAGARSVRMGTEVLRTSTAGVVGLAVIASRTERW